MSTDRFIVVEVESGCVRDVYGLPPGWGYDVVDWDDMTDEEEEEAHALIDKAQGYCPGCGDSLINCDGSCMLPDPEGEGCNSWEEVDGG